MAIRKKRRTAAQIAATKKMLAGLKKYRKKNPVKKKVAKKKSVSRTTKQGVKRTVKQQKRYKKRVTGNVKKGYYPNPAMYIIIRSSRYGATFAATKYFDGAQMVTNKKNAARYTTQKQALKIAQKLADQTGYKYGVETVKK